MPNGTLTKKIQRHPTVSVSRPPSTGPSAGRDERRDHHDRRRPGPLDRREGPEQHRDADRREHPAADALQDPERDELADRLGAARTATEPPTNSTSAMRNTRLVPKRSPSQPLAGIHTASDSV